MGWFLLKGEWFYLEKWYLLGGEGYLLEEERFRLGGRGFLLDGEFLLGGEGFFLGARGRAGALAPSSVFAGLPTLFFSTFFFVLGGMLMLTNSYLLY